MNYIELREKIKELSSNNEITFKAKATLINLINIQETKQLSIHGVVKPFYCNHDDGEYHNDPCAEQCNFCKGVESLQ